MKTSLKKSLLIAVGVILSTSAFAQKTAKSTIKTNSNGKTVEMTLQNDALTSLVLDGRNIPESEWKNYDTLIKTTVANVKSDRIAAENDRKSAVEDQKLAARDRESAVADIKRAQADIRRANEDKKNAALDQKRAAEDRAEAKRDRDLAAGDRAAASKDRERATADRQLINSVTSDLITDHVIKDAKSLRELEINETGITVNGTKQPVALFKKYSSRYGSFSGRNFKYTFHEETSN